MPEVKKTLPTNQKLEYSYTNRIEMARHSNIEKRTIAHNRKRMALLLPRTLLDLIILPNYKETPAGSIKQRIDGSSRAGATGLGDLLRNAILTQASRGRN